MRLRKTRNLLSTVTNRIRTIQVKIDSCCSGVLESVDLKDHVDKLTRDAEDFLMTVSLLRSIR